MSKHELEMSSRSSRTAAGAQRRVAGAREVAANNDLKMIKDGDARCHKNASAPSPVAVAGASGALLQFRWI